MRRNKSRALQIVAAAAFFPLSISTASPDVKTAITPTSTEGIYTAAWAKGDKMRIYIDAVSPSGEGGYTLPAGKVTTLRVGLSDTDLQNCVDVLLNEDFSSVKNGNNTSTSGSGTLWNGNDNFPSVVKAYQAGGAVKLGTGSTAGSITSKPLNLSSAFTVSFKVKGWTTVEGDVVVTAGSQSKTLKYTSTVKGSFETVSATFNGESANCEVKIATSAKRCFIDDVTIEQPGKPATSAPGWAELPTTSPGSNMELCKHSSLPSGSGLRNYSFLFDRDRHCSLWVAWPLHSCYLGDSDRTNAFDYDPDFIVNDYEANLSPGAYYPQGGSSYSHSRGHQLPSAERTLSEGDNKTTFYATNMTPQLQDFNGNIWETLEAKERTEYICSDTLYIVSGPYFDPNATPVYVYDNKGRGKACQVPTHYWKIFLRTKAGNTGKNVSDCSSSELQCAGFWFKHEKRTGQPKISDMKTVSEIEILTGFTFFPNVPNAPKTVFSASDWGVGE